MHIAGISWEQCTLGRVTEPVKQFVEEAFPRSSRKYLDDEDAENRMTLEGRPNVKMWPGPPLNSAADLTTKTAVVVQGARDGGHSWLQKD